MRNFTKKTYEVSPSIPYCCSKRWNLAVAAFFGLFSVYAVRLNLSVAIVCMVRIQNREGNLNMTKGQTSTCTAKTVLNTTREQQHAEFDWSKTDVSTVLSAVYYGYMMTSILGGWLADRFGGRKVFGVAMTISTVFTILTPLCARTSLVLLYVARVIIGMATGVTIPAIQSMWGRWAPPTERSKLISSTFLGTVSGSFSTFMISGILCEEGFDNGWGSIFYVTGLLSFVVVVGWFKATADTPEKHRKISQAELKYIDSSIEFNTKLRTSKVPWKKLIQSKPLWALTVAHMSSNWVAYSLQTMLPTFMMEILHLDATRNGILSAIPFILQALGTFISGPSADILLSRKYFTVTQVRKIFQITSLLGSSAFLICTGFVPCDRKEVAVVGLAISTFFLGLCRSGYTSNYVDIGPKYAGFLYGISNTFATTPGMIGPIIAGLLTPNRTQEEWRHYFYVIGIICVFGSLVFGLFASGEHQDWAKDEAETRFQRPSQQHKKEKEEKKSEANYPTFNDNIDRTEENFCKIYTVQI